MTVFAECSLLDEETQVNGVIGLVDYKGLQLYHFRHYVPVLRMVMHLIQVNPGNIFCHDRCTLERICFVITMRSVMCIGNVQLKPLDSNVAPVLELAQGVPNSSLTSAPLLSRHPLSRRAVVLRFGCFSIFVTLPFLSLSYPRATLCLEPNPAVCGAAFWTCLDYLC